MLPAPYKYEITNIVKYILQNTEKKPKDLPPIKFHNKEKIRPHKPSASTTPHVMAAIIAACRVVSLGCAAVVVGRVAVAASFSINISSTKMCARKYKIVETY